ncbi:hypothetical protein HDV02_001449 [Globomyces sp. JEL0801]|nr:hypothetical protein HDV02_001449 [Globomyces sp. JEL0801]
MTNDQSHESIFPKESNGYQYCNVSGSHFAIKGYETVLFLASDACVDSSVRCFRNQSLFLYPNQSCQGLPLTYQLQKTDTKYDGHAQGIETGNFVDIQKGITETTWLAILPGKLVTPSVSSWIECVQSSSYVFTGMLDILLLVYIIKLRRRSFNMFYIVSQAIWTIYNIFFVWFLFTVTDSDEEYMITYHCLMTLFNIATLCSAVQTTMLFFRFQGEKLTVFMKSGIVFVLLGLHIGLAGSNYFLYCLLPNRPYCINYDILKIWRAYAQNWILAFFIWNTIPPLLMVGSLVSSVHNEYQTLSVLRLIFKQDYWFNLYIVIQILLITAYYTMAALTSYTNILGSDLYFGTLKSYQNFAISSHSVIVVLLLERVMVLVRRHKGEEKANEMIDDNVSTSVNINDYFGTVDVNTHGETVASSSNTSANPWSFEQSISNK